ncbi:MAG: hypothetical protein CMN30_23750 [Sandaracinus sp.]|nr:hypothetical protein [Sandaracinus sp.]|tara:strand:- start:4114 stop:4494 length:381 start_codon:yes stop_codon:yes gene_type:complete
MVGRADDEATLFEALWAPRWFGQDQSLARGQESVFAFRGPVPPPSPGFLVLAAGLEKPRYDARCRLLDIRHAELGKLQAIEAGTDQYRFVRAGGDVVHVAADGSVMGGHALPPADWTVRCVFEILL